MTRKEFIQFIKLFRNDLENNKSEWENKTIEKFLEAMEAYTEDILAIINDVENLYKEKFITWHKPFCDIEGIYYED